MRRHKNRYRFRFILLRASHAFSFIAIIGFLTFKLSRDDDIAIVSAFFLPFSVHLTISHKLDLYPLNVVIC